MNIFNKLVFFVIVTAIGTIYKRYQDNNMKKKIIKDNKLINNYLKKNIEMLKNYAREKKKIIWIYDDFQSNKSYNYLKTKCIEKIKEFNKDFKVIIINDTNIKNFIPDIEVDLKFLSGQQKNNIIHLLMIKLLYNWGGILIPNIFYPLKNFNNLPLNKLSIFECKSFLTNNYIDYKYLPNNEFIVSNSNNKILIDYINYLEYHISKDNSKHSYFNEYHKLWWNDKINKCNINYISGKYIGIKNKFDEPIVIENIFSDINIYFDKDCYGIYIPDYYLLKKK